MYGTLMLMAGITFDSVIASDNLVCHEKICYPKDYHNLPKLPKDATVYFDFEPNGAEMKKVDDIEMMITFAPETMMIWNDPRLRLPTNVTVLEWAKLPDELLKKIWYPKVTVEDKTPRISPYHDPGNMCRFMEVYSRGSK